MSRRQKLGATLSGIRVVAAYELRVRHQAKGWRGLLAVWFVGVCALTGAVAAAVGRGGDRPGGRVFGWSVVLLVLLLLLVVPALARPPDGHFAEGARTEPRLAGLEATELALGELLAAWVVVAVLVLLAVPALVACTASGGVGPASVAGAAAALLAVLCAVAALAQWRPGWTYLIVAALSLGTPLAYSAALKITQYDVEEYDAAGRVAETRTVDRPHKVWWVLAANPFVIVADAARPGAALNAGPSDPLTDMSAAIRDARDADGPAWPEGLLFLTVVGTCAVGVTTTRLRDRQDRAVVR